MQQTGTNSTHAWEAATTAKATRQHHRKKRESSCGSVQHTTSKDTAQKRNSELHNIIIANTKYCPLLVHIIISLLKRFPQCLCSSIHLVSLPVLFHCLATKTIDSHHEIYRCEFAEHAIFAGCDDRYVTDAAIVQFCN